MSVEHIIKDFYGNFTCQCGNTALGSGFFPSNEIGEPLETPLDAWPIALYTCDQCGRVINYETAEVVGQRREIACTADGKPICPCGQIAASLYPSDGEGKPVDDSQGAQTSSYFTCDSCGRILVWWQGDSYVVAWKEKTGDR